MHVASVNGKKYIHVIIDDYSCFTCVKCLKSKDEAPYFIIKFLKMIQVRLKTPVRRIRTYNGTEFVNHTLREYYEKLGISHETSVARSSQQNVASEPSESTSSPFSTTVDQDAPSPSNSLTTPETQTHVLSNAVEEDNHDLDIAHMNNDPSFGVEESPKTPTFYDDPLYKSLHEESNSLGSSSNMRQIHTPFESLGRWTKDHPIAK
nr:integrase, catalytic region, zinc finger, CCHC-type, peptidase aspartic, catalytic [Tanacetum cinerariifolium]